MRLRLFARDLLTALTLLLLVFLLIFVYTSTWPPFVRVEGTSMQHDHLSVGGVIDPGDIVLLRANANVVTYVEAKRSGHSTYGDLGDVIVFRHPEFRDVTVIHRAVMYINPNASGGYDIPALNLSGVQQVRIDGMGWRHDLNITFRLDWMERRAGYVTMGDNNAYTDPPGYDPWIVPDDNISGIARGEVSDIKLLVLLATGMFVVAELAVWSRRRDS